MKTNFKIYLAACTVVAALGSCNQEAVIEGAGEALDKETRTLTMQASLGGNSRIAFQEDSTAIHLLWEDKDSFSVLAGTAVQTPSVFTLKEGAGTSQGKFSGEVSCEDGDMLYGIWPVMEDSMTTDNEYYWSLDGQTGVLNDQYTFMWGKGQYQEGESVRMSFRYMTAALRMKLALPTDIEKITKVEVHGGNVWSGATVSLATGELEFDGSKYISTIDQEFDVVDGSAEVVAYFFVNQESTLSNTFVLVTDDKGTEYFGFMGDGGVEPGMLYDVSVDVTPLVDFANEAVADGSVKNPYEIANAEQLYSFMLRCNRNEGNVDGFPYSGLNYKLTSDIELDGSIKWLAPNFYGRMFDGNGKTISGKIEDSFFDLVGVDLDESTTIQNLTLDLEFSLPEYRTYGPFGCLAKNANDADILNCVNHSSVTVAAWYVGGLVGQMDYLSTMIGCANEGHVTVYNSEIESIGGLVGRMGGSSFIEACYNRGTLTTSSSECDKGSIVGYIDVLPDGTTYNGRVTSCWTTGSVDIVGVGEYTSCYMVDTIPTSEQIATMNAALEEAGSFCRFDENAQPVNQLKDVGSSSGSDLPIDGIY